MLQASGKEVVRALERVGWVRMQSAGGSHVRLQRRDGTGRVVVPIHANKPLKVGTIASILKMADLTEAELKELL